MFFGERNTFLKYVFNDFSIDTNSIRVLHLLLEFGFDTSLKSSSLNTILVIPNFLICATIHFDKEKSFINIHYALTAKWVSIKISWILSFMIDDEMIQRYLKKVTIFQLNTVNLFSTGRLYNILYMCDYTLS